jgi:hypothetical protein
MEAFVNWFVGLFSNWAVVWRNFDYLLIGAYPKGPLGGLAMSIIMATQASTVMHTVMITATGMIMSTGIVMTILMRQTEPVSKEPVTSNARCKKYWR